MHTMIPESFRDLVHGPRVAALTTLMPDGQPQTTVVWCSFDGAHVLINTMRGFRKEKNMRADPRVTILAFDPHNPLYAGSDMGNTVWSAVFGQRVPAEVTADVLVDLRGEKIRA